jgi:hypothetical protein
VIFVLQDCVIVLLKGWMFVALQGCVIVCVARLRDCCVERLRVCCVARLRDCCVARLRYCCVERLRDCSVARLRDCCDAKKLLESQISSTLKKVELTYIQNIDLGLIVQHCISLVDIYLSSNTYSNGTENFDISDTWPLKEFSINAFSRYVSICSKRSRNNFFCAHATSRDALAQSAHATICYVITQPLATI